MTVGEEINFKIIDVTLMMIKWYLIFLAGGVGSMMRYVFSGFVCQLLGTRFPYGTLVINLLGCFIIGFLVTITESKFLLSANIRLALVVGFLGAFTTFSAFILETANLIKDGQIFLAFTNILVSVAVGLMVFYLGILLGKFLL